MTGVILAGGLGTRLRSVLPDTAKPLAPVDGRPFLFFLLDQLADAQVAPYVLCTGHLAAQVRDEIGQEFRGADVLYSEEDRPMGTAGALKLAWRNFPNTAPWLVANGDSFVDIDLRAMIESHRKSGLSVTIAGVRVEDGRRYGSLELSDNSRVGAFREKSGEPGPRWINGGIYIMEAEFLNAIPDDTPLSLETSVFPGWIENGIHLFASEARFIDIGTPESYGQARGFFRALS